MLALSILASLIYSEAFAVNSYSYDSFIINIQIPQQIHNEVIEHLEFKSFGGEDTKSYVLDSMKYYVPIKDMDRKFQFSIITKTKIYLFFMMLDTEYYSGRFCPQIKFDVRTSKKYTNLCIQCAHLSVCTCISGDVYSKKRNKLIKNRTPKWNR